MYVVNCELQSGSVVNTEVDTLGCGAGAGCGIETGKGGAKDRGGPAGTGRTGLIGAAAGRRRGE